MPDSLTLRLLWLLIACGLTGCEQGQDGGIERDGGPSGDGDGESGGDGAPRGDGDGDRGDPFDVAPVMHSTREVCDELLECADGQSPSKFGEFFPVYGADGSCFAERTEAACREACIDAMHGMGCNYCDDDAHCGAGRCHPVEHHCVSCFGVADCGGDDAFAFCHPERLTCTQCIEDEHCGFLDDPDCAFDKPQCDGEGACYSLAYQGQVGFTLRGSGLSEFDGEEVVYYLEYQTDGCHNDVGYPWLDDEPSRIIANGALELFEDDYLPIPARLHFTLSAGARNYRFERLLEPNGADRVLIELTRADLIPQD